MFEDPICSEAESHKKKEEKDKRQTSYMSYHGEILLIASSLLRLLLPILLLLLFEERQNKIGTKVEDEDFFFLDFWKTRTFQRIVAVIMEKRLLVILPNIITNSNSLR